MMTIACEQAGAGQVARVRQESPTMTDVFRVPMEVTYAIEGGEPALMAYRRWRNISRDDLAVKSGIPRHEIDAGKLLTYAATLDATAIVWIAERFTDEHR